MKSVGVGFPADQQNIRPEKVNELSRLNALFRIWKCNQGFPERIQIAQTAKKGR
jgi:hypothetical protein